MLRLTGVMDVEEAATVAGIDLTKKEFWREGLETIKKQIDMFEELCK
jgi:oligoendopeptidase F